MHLFAAELSATWPETGKSWVGAGPVDWKLLIGERVRIAVLLDRPCWISVAAACGWRRALRLLLEQSGACRVSECTVTAVDYGPNLRVRLGDAAPQLCRQQTVTLDHQVVTVTLPLRLRDCHASVRRMGVWPPTCSVPGCTAPRQLGLDCFAHGMSAPAARLAPRAQAARAIPSATIA